MGQTIELTAADQHKLSAYVAEPAGAPRGGVVVIQEIFGVNGHIRSVVDDFAAEGFLAIAPAIFDRAERGVELDYSPESVAQGRELAMKVAGEPALTDVKAAMDWAGEHAAGKVGVVGYCFGGTLAWFAATRLRPAAVVSYYGGQVAQFVYERPSCPVIFHFGDHDAHIPVSDIEKLQDAHPDCTIFRYPAGHGFNCDHRSDYNAEAARLARLRTLDFLRKYLGA